MTAGLSTISQDPLISVIIPTYNRATMVERAVVSVLNQSLHRFELLILDDGSCDDTERRLTALDDPRIVIRKLSHSGHLAQLRQLGIDSASSDLLAFLDSDDWWDAGHLQSLYDTLQRHPDAVFAVSDVRLVSAQGRVLKPALYGLQEDDCRRFFEDLVTMEKVIYPSSTLLRKAHIAYAYDQGLQAGDHDFFVKNASTAVTCFNRSVTVNIGRHDSHLSDSLGWRNMEEARQTIGWCRDHDLIAAGHAKLLTAQTAYREAMAHRSDGRRWQATGTFMRASRCLACWPKAPIRMLLAPVGL